MFINNNIMTPNIVNSKGKNDKFNSIMDKIEPIKVDFEQQENKRQYERREHKRTSMEEDILGQL